MPATAEVIRFHRQHDPWGELSSFAEALPSFCTAHYGDGGDGKNRLGVLLMQLREELRASD